MLTIERFFNPKRDQKGSFKVVPGWQDKADIENITMFLTK